MSQAISPLDGRYRKDAAFLRNYFSERALIDARVWVEIMYFGELSRAGVIRPLTDEELKYLTQIQNLSWKTFRIKIIEKKTKPDTKAVEYFLKERFKGTTLVDLSEFIHFGITSADTDNLAWGTLFRQALQEELKPTIFGLCAQVSQMAKEYKDYPMLGRAPGQPAVPTTVGKELEVFATRLYGELDKLENLKIPVKFSGAGGNFYALKSAYPRIDWEDFSKRFVNSLDYNQGFSSKQSSLQIPPYDDLCEIFDCARRINIIVIDLDRDILDYFSRGYFFDSNPIDFERSEAYLKVSNALLEVLSRELPLRDHTDKDLSPVVGEALGFAYLSWKSTKKGLMKIHPDLKALQADLLNHWECLSEAIQTILRKHGYKEDDFKELARLKNERGIDFLTYRRITEELKLKISLDAWEEISQLHPLIVI